MEQKLTLFEDELNMIQNNILREQVCTFLLTRVPDYFWRVPASSSGKYHPSFSNGPIGLVRHTKMVVAVLNELVKLQEYSHMQEVIDSMIAACIMHDSFKHGYKEGKTITSHPTMAADEWADHVGSENMKKDNYKIVYYCILKHMGQWGPKSAEQPTEGYIKGCTDLVHLADYIASRKFFDMYAQRIGADDDN